MMLRKISLLLGCLLFAIAVSATDDQPVAPTRANSDPTVVPDAGQRLTQRDPKTLSAHGVGANPSQGTLEADRIIPVSPDGKGTYRGAPAMRFQDALQHWQPGMEIVLTPGVYSQPMLIERGGDFEHPLRIRGIRGRTILDGNSNPTVPDLTWHGENCAGEESCTWDPVYYAPRFEDHAMIRLSGAEHVSIEGITIRNSWPNGIYIQDSRNISISDSEFEGATFAIHASGERTSHIRLEQNRWTQVPGSGKRFFETVHWEHAHHGRTNYLNGAFFGSENIVGDVSISRNQIRNAFNGIRMEVDPKRCLSPDTCTKQLNRNVNIADNCFSFIRDNAFEPERAANDWTIHGNTVCEAHAALSLDNVEGAVYFYDNLLVSSVRPGGPNSGGRAIKFLKHGDPPRLRLEVYGNHFDLGFDPEYASITGRNNRRLFKGIMPPGVDFGTWRDNTFEPQCSALLFDAVEPDHDPSDLDLEIQDYVRNICTTHPPQGVVVAGSCEQRC
jgi:parallel beta-helix repeat protein